MYNYTKRQWRKHMHRKICILLSGISNVSLSVRAISSRRMPYMEDSDLGPRGYLSASFYRRKHLHCNSKITSWPQQQRCQRWDARHVATIQKISTFWSNQIECTSLGENYLLVSLSIESIYHYIQSKTTSYICPTLHVYY